MFLTFGRWGRIWLDGAILVVIVGDMIQNIVIIFGAETLPLFITCLPAFTRYLFLSATSSLRIRSLSEAEVSLLQTLTAR